ncbi:MAG: hypothetical protein JW817_07355 [Clostridiales bacterium]|nr:hypothetical protein [Clostridiales bacterium]
MSNGTIIGRQANTHSNREGDSMFRPIFLIPLVIALAALAALFYFFAKQYFTVVLIGTVVMVVILLINVLTGNAGKIVRTVVRVISVILALVAIMSIGIVMYAPSQIFYPNFDEQAYRELSGESDAVAVSIPTEQGALSGWLLNNAEGQSPLILYFGGNGENSATRMLKLCRSEEARGVFEGFNFAFIDYPTYGQSEGELNEEALFRYALDVYDHFSADPGVTDIVPMGYSMGTGPANYVASKRDVAGLILMAPYADFYDMYNSSINIFHGPMRLLVTFKMESIRFAEDIRVIPLVFASEADEMIPFVSSERLVRAYPEAPVWVSLKDARHNDFWGREEVLTQIGEYLDDVVAEP